MIQGIIDKGLQLGIIAGKYINTKESRKYIDKIIETRQKLELELRRKLDDQDDVLIENMYKDLEIFMEGIRYEIENSNASNV